MLVALALTTSSGAAGAAPALSEDRIDLDIGETANLDAKVYFNVAACTKKEHCFALYEFWDLLFNEGQDCGEKSAPVPLAVAKCSFHVDGGLPLGPFEAGAGVFVAPATGQLICGSPETLSDRWDEEAESWAEDNGYRCRGEVVPVPDAIDYITLTRRSK